MPVVVWTREQFKAMIHAAGETIFLHKDELSALDAATGDGDHGTAMDAAMRSACESVEKTQNTDQSFAQLLQDMGWNTMSGSGGATSTLMGSFWLGMGTTLRAMRGEGERLTPDEVSVLFTGGLANVRKQTKAKPGDKTMLDALIPAVEAMQNQTDCRTQFAMAAQAARKGATSTVPMQARQGRAKNLGERSVGCQDPGATSIALIFEAFSHTFDK